MVPAGVKILFVVGGTAVVGYGEASKILVKGHGWRGIELKKHPITDVKKSVDNLDTQPDGSCAHESTNGSAATSEEDIEKRKRAEILAHQAAKMGVSPNGPWICSTCLKELGTLDSFQVSSMNSSLLFSLA